MTMIGSAAAYDFTDQGAATKINLELGTSAIPSWPNSDAFKGHKLIGTGSGEHTFTIVVTLRDFPALDKLIYQKRTFKLTLTSVC